MALPILAGFALRGIGNLISRRRAMRGRAFGRAMNTQPQGPPQGPVTGTPGLGSAAVDPSVVGINQTRPLPGMSAAFDAKTSQGSGFDARAEFDAIRAGPGPKSNAGPGNVLTNESRAPGPGSGQGNFQTQEVLSGQSAQAPGGGEGAALGAASIARSRRRNRQQQSALSSQALR